MCGCEQGTCPGNCRCGCSHTPPTDSERRLIKQRDEYYSQWQKALERLHPDTSDELMLSRITITRRLLDTDADESDIVSTTVDGDPHLIDALGMLAMATNSFLRGELE